MKLNILERIIGIQAINQYEVDHQRSSFITFKTIEKLKHKLLVNEEETTKYNLRVENDSYKWDDSGTLEYVDFEFTEGEMKIVSEGLLSMDKKEELTKDHLSTYEKFVPIEA